MRRLLALVGALTLVLVACGSGDDGDTTTTTASGRTATSASSAGTSPSGGGEVFDISGDETIQVEAGSTFTLSLEANATTGYNWSQKVDGAAVRKQGDEYVPPGEALPGKGGTQLFTYDAVEAGTATIALTYSQVGSGDVGQEYTVTVEVS